MSFYERHILPRFINCACGSSPIMKQREKVVPQAKGVVLEIGIGTGLNLPILTWNLSVCPRVKYRWTMAVWTLFWSPMHCVPFPTR